MCQAILNSAASNRVKMEEIKVYFKDLSLLNSLPVEVVSEVAQLESAVPFSEMHLSLDNLKRHSKPLV